MRIALLGAGHIGQTIARWLALSGDYQVTVVDRDRGALDRLLAENLPGLQVRCAETSDPVALLAVLRGQQAVVNALPYHLATLAATQAREAGCHYFDLTEDVAATRAIQKLADGSPTAFMPQCGLAPGFIGIVAHHLAQSFDTLHEVQMRVGALPAFPTNALKYNLTWSVDGLINEYCHPCEAIRDGRTSRCCRWKAWSISAWTAPSTRPSTPAAAWARCAKPWPAVCARWTTKACVTPATVA